MSNGRMNPPRGPQGPGAYGPGPEGDGGVPGRRGRIGALEETTTQFEIPVGYGAYYGPPQPYPPQSSAGLSRDTLVRIVIWVIPLIFMAGTLYISIQTTMARQEAQEERLRQVSDRVTTMASDQRVLQEHIAALRTAGDRIQPQFDELREQLIALRTDIAAIREKLGIAASRSR